MIYSPCSTQAKGGKYVVQKPHIQMGDGGCHGLAGSHSERHRYGGGSDVRRPIAARARKGLPVWGALSLLSKI